ncbi:MAG: recombinase family protein [Candidatus Obscuribacterales bacterium]|nr:recombinase family protein [Candidatus Obscuribacterales bacterium]
MAEIHGIAYDVTDKSRDWQFLFLHSLEKSQSWADTTSPSGRVVMTFFAGMAEFERDLIRDRTSVGRTAALERGVKFGRPAKMTDEQLRQARNFLKKGKSIHYVADLFGVHFTTLYRYLRA